MKLVPQGIPQTELLKLTPHPFHNVVGGNTWNLESCWALVKDLNHSLIVRH